MKQHFAHRPPSNITLLNDPWPRDAVRPAFLTRRSRKKEFFRLLKSLRKSAEQVAN
jgi:hypothetical protein